MEIRQRMLTGNDCYRAGRYIKPRGVMVHSTATPGVMAEEWCRKWNRPGVGACVHAFVDNSGVYQCLPWDMRGWHAGGDANDTHISFEICEPAGIVYNKNGSVIIEYDAEAQSGYFDAVWNNSAELCAMLCAKYGLDEGDVICHSEGHLIGVASNHADVAHWFPKHGRSMDDFRAEVARRLREGVDGPSDWARDACGWAVELGLFNGDGCGEFNWRQPMTRESVAVVLRRYRELITGEE